MTNVQRKGFFLLAFLCGVIAAGSMYFYLRGADKNVTVALKPLVYVKSNISARTVIEAGQLTLKEVPVQGYPQGGFTSIQDVTGSVALLNLSAGDIIVRPMLQLSPKKSDEGSGGSSEALTVPPGKRAVAIPINLVSGVGYAVKPGDHVDVLVTMDINNPADNQSQTVTNLVAQDVLVLNAGESISAGQSKVDAKSFTLALTVPQAMAVTLGIEKGNIQLLLRNPVNKEIIPENPVKTSAFLDPNYINGLK